MWDTEGENMQSEWLAPITAIMMIAVVAAGGIFLIIDYDNRENKRYIPHGIGWKVELWNTEYGYPVRLKLVDDLVVGREILCKSDQSGMDVPVDFTISRVHMLLFTKGGNLWIKNLSSTNPMMVNNTYLTAPCKLLPGDRLRLGRSVYIATQIESLKPSRKNRSI